MWIWAAAIALAAFVVIWWIERRGWSGEDRPGARTGESRLRPWRDRAG
jgi:hypothetical protein